MDFFFEFLATYELGDYVASGGCGTVMMCRKREDPHGEQYILKYMNLDELTFNKANGAQREAQERVDRWLQYEIAQYSSFW